MMRILVALSFMFGSAWAQPYVVADSVIGSFQCDGYVENTYLTQIISICNPDSVKNQMTLVFRIYHKSGIVPSQPTVQYYNGIDTLFDSPISVEYLLENNGWTVAISMSAASPGKGLPVSPDTIPYIGLSVLLGGNINDSLCFDSTYSASLGG
jgi:hypothetical protein